MKREADRRERIYRTLSGLPLRGRRVGSQTGTEPGKRSIPKVWRDLDKGCLEFALNEYDESCGDEYFVSCAVRRARFHVQRGDYRVIKLSDKLTEGKATGTRRPRTHEQRVRRKAKEVLKEASREQLGFIP
jgi:hypothetical protein